jgi:hypothetical protein
MAKRSKRQVKTYIQDLLQQVGWVTYPQLLRYLSNKSVDVTGEFNLEVTERNVLLWGNLSKVVVDAITELMREQELLLIPAPPQTYQLDHFNTNQPIITVIPQEKLETPVIFLTVLQNNKPVKAEESEV